LFLCRCAYNCCMLVQLFSISLTIILIVNSSRFETMTFNFFLPLTQISFLFLILISIWALFSQIFVYAFSKGNITNLIAKIECGFASCEITTYYNTYHNLVDKKYSFRPAILDLLGHFTQIKKSVKMKEREWYFYWIALIIIFKPSLF
jgi:hypothetical protein